ncbi:MAG: hypothetical protein VCD34_14600 [Planctomycetota bacterium]|jgi:hypothetical protein
MNNSCSSFDSKTGGHELARPNQDQAFALRNREGKPFGFLF